MNTRRFRSVLRSTSIAISICLATAGGARAQAQAPDEPLSPQVLAQIAALQQAKASRTPAEQKISSRLLYAIKQQRGEPLPAGVSLRAASLADTGGRIDVEIASRPGTNLHGLLASRNAAVTRVNTEPRSGVVYARARVDANGILALAARADVTAVHLPERVESVDVTRDVGRAASAIQAALGQGAFVTEGLLTHGFNIARAAFGLDGTGVKIGVLASGVDNLAASQAAGELGPVTVLSGQAGSGDDGTAILEILHDLVPGAQLYFATGASGVLPFAQNIRDLRAAGCDIILDSLLYAVESPFHDGQAAPFGKNLAVITQAVNDVTAAGALYFATVPYLGNLDDSTSGVWEGHAEWPLIYGAAAPHAAAIAALLKQARPAATPAEIRTWLTSTALDIHALGPDRNSGHGIVMPMPALTAAGATGGAAFDVSSYVLEENPGNGDGVVFGGEGAKLTLSLANLGLSAASNISATLTTTTPGVTITQPAARAFPNAAASSTVTNTIPFTFTLASDAASGLAVNATLTVSYAESATPQVLSVVVTTGACAACTRNRVPVAVVRNVTVMAGPNGTAAATIDNGSSEVDGDPLTITASPAGPYAVGVTTVMLTVADDKGATSQATATVTVLPFVPPPPPTITSIAPAGGTTVSFGAAPGIDVLCVSTIECAVTSPAGTGIASVRVTVAAAGTSADTAAADFTFTDTRVYLLGEGATGAFFDEDLLLANANAVEAPVTIRFFTEGGQTIPMTRTLAAQSRATVHVDAIPGLEATAVAAEITSEHGLPLAVERTMFWDAAYYAGHTAAAQPAPATAWYFAEGAQGFFDTYILVNNPNTSATDVTFTFLREAETPVTRRVTVDARSRFTLGASTIPELIDRAFSIILTSVQPVTTDRAMYFGTTPGQLWGGGTASSGSVLSRSGISRRARPDRSSTRSYCSAIRWRRTRTSRSPICSTTARR